MRRRERLDPAVGSDEPRRLTAGLESRFGSVDADDDTLKDRFWMSRRPVYD